jgi:hypothetical protein
MSCPRYCYTFTYELITGAWSFYCIYADDLQSARREFEKIPDELYYITAIDRADNRYTARDPQYEPYTRVYEGGAQ